jgi:hypothetical protein
MLILFYNLSTANNQQHDYTAKFTKRRYRSYFGNSQKNTDDNLKPAIALLKSWG